MQLRELKKIFSIIASRIEAHYGVDTVSKSVLVWCILHNYLMMYDPNEDILCQVNYGLMQNPIEKIHSVERIVRDIDARQGEKIINNMASYMWNDHVLQS